MWNTICICYIYLRPVIGFKLDCTLQTASKAVKLILWPDPVTGSRTKILITITMSDNCLWKGGGYYGLLCTVPKTLTLKDKKWWQDFPVIWSQRTHLGHQFVTISSVRRILIFHFTAKNVQILTFTVWLWCKASSFIAF